MPRIEEIIGEGPELSKSQAAVLSILEKHPGHLFRNDDLTEIQLWLVEPDAEELSAVSSRNSSIYSLKTIRWALSTLQARGRIGSIKIHRHTYYGSDEAIKKAAAADGQDPPITKVTVVFPDGTKETRSV